MAGSNPRSVLFAVYRYLRELGFRWLRPGKRGEVVPKLRSIVLKGADINETASYRYRTITIEGACSFEHVRDLIDWMAKQQMNGYFIQFHLGTIFFKRWYEHRGSKNLKPESLDQKKLEAGVAGIVREIEKRGMNFERMGHGWTCAALGISGEVGWDVSKSDDVPEEKREWLAQITGKCELFGGITLNTNLNYGNPQVRETMTDAIVEYASENREVKPDPLLACRRVEQSR